MKNRSSHTFERFVESTSGKKEILEIVWRSFMSESVFGNFKVMPNDSIEYVFGLADEDLDELIIEILNNLNVNLPPQGQFQNYPPVATVKDFIDFIDYCQTMSMSEKGRDED